MIHALTYSKALQHLGYTMGHVIVVHSNVYKYNVVY